jgi:two-component system phosphate regulon response regulator PhoB
LLLINQVYNKIECKELFVSSVLIVHRSERAAEGFLNIIKDWGYDVTLVTDQNVILDTINTTKPDVLILGGAADGYSSLKLSRELNKQPFSIDIPSLLIAADPEEGDMAVVAEKTVSDCLISPFSIDELKNKIEALLPKQFNKTEQEVFEYAGVVLNSSSYRVTRDGVPLQLTPKCFSILKCLLKHPTHVVSRHSLMSEIWGTKARVEERTVDVHIKRLRTALNEGSFANILRTVRGAGYSIDINPL